MAELDLSLSDALTDSVPQLGPESLVERDFVAQLESEIFDDQVGETVGKTDYIPLLDNDDTKADAGSTLENGEQEAHGVQKPGTGMNLQTGAALLQSEKAMPPVRSEVTKEHSPMKPEPQPPRSPLDLSAGAGYPEPAAFHSPHTGFFTSSSEQRTNCENPAAAAAGGDEREADGLDRKQQKKKKKRRQKEEGFYEHLESRGKSETQGLEENVSPTEEGSHWVRPQQDRGDGAWEEPLGKSAGRTKRVKSRKKPPEEFGVMADTFVPSSSASPRVTEEVLLDLGSPHTSPELAPFGPIDTKDLSDPNLVPGPLSEDLFLSDSSLIPLVLNSELKATAAPFTMPPNQTLGSKHADSFDLLMTTENNINQPLSPVAEATAGDMVDSGMFDVSSSVHVNPDADTSAFSSTSKSSPALSPYGVAVASAPPLSPSDASWLMNESRMSSSSELFDFSLETESPKPLRTPKTTAPVKRSPSPESRIPPQTSASSPPSAGVLGSGLNPSAKPFFPCFADLMKDDMTSAQVSPSIKASNISETTAHKKDTMEKQIEQFEPLVEQKSVKLENVSSKTPTNTDEEKHEEPLTEKEKVDSVTKKTDAHTDEVEEQQKEIKKQEEREVHAQKEERETAQWGEKETEKKTQKKETAMKEEPETAKKEVKEIAKKEENVPTQREEKETEKKVEKEIASKEEKETTQREEQEIPKKELVKKEEKEMAKTEEKETAQREKEDKTFGPQEKKSKASEEKKVDFKAEVETTVKKVEDLESDESKVREQGDKSTHTVEIKDVKEQLQIEKQLDQKEQQISISTSSNDEKVEKDDVQLKTPAEEQVAEKGNNVGKVKEMPSEEKEVKQDKAQPEKKAVEKKVGQKPVKTDAEEKAKKTSKLTANLGSAASGKDGSTAGKKSAKPVVGATKPAAKPGQGLVPTASTKRPPTSSTASTSDKKTSTLRAPSATTAAAAPGTKRPPSSTTATRDLKPKTATAEKRPLQPKTSTVASAGTSAASKTGGPTSTSRAPTSARTTLGARNPVATSSKTDSRPGEEKKSSTVRSATVNSLQPKTSTTASRTRAPAPKAASASSSSEATAGKKLVAPSTTRPTSSTTASKPAAAAAAARPGTAPATRNTRTKISSTDSTKHEAAAGKVQMVSKKTDFSHVTSRLGSKDNMKHVAGGGNVQILNKKVDVMKVASKCGSKDNIKHKPGGGDVKVDSHKVNIKSKTQTKVDPIPSVKTECSSEATGDNEMAPPLATPIAPPPAPGPQLDQPGDANDSTALDSFIPETSL